MGHDAPGHVFVHEHRDVMLLFVRSFREGTWRRLLIMPLLVMSGLLVYVVDKGGSLVFEYGMGVKAISEEPELETNGHEHDNRTESQIHDSHSSTPDSNIKSGDSDEK